LRKHSSSSQHKIERTHKKKKGEDEQLGVREKKDWRKDVDQTSGCAEEEEEDPKIPEDNNPPSPFPAIISSSIKFPP
jgi:hypothetical protein